MIVFVIQIKKCQLRICAMCNGFVGNVHKWLETWFSGSFARNYVTWNLGEVIVEQVNYTIQYWHNTKKNVMRTMLCMYLLERVHHCIIVALIKLLGRNKQHLWAWSLAEWTALDKCEECTMLQRSCHLNNKFLDDLRTIDNTFYYFFITLFCSEVHKSAVHEILSMKRTWQHHMWPG